MNHTLIGMFDSPFVRRVAITMHIYGIEFGHHRWSVFGDYDRIRALSPLGRVPVLLLDDHEALVDSSSILDYLDEIAGPEKSLTPPSGAARRRALKHQAVAMGGCEKAVALFYETVKRDSRYTDPEWSRRLVGQIHQAVAWLEANVPGKIDPIDQCALTSALFWRFLYEYLPEVAAGVSAPQLRALSEHCESMPAFRAIPFGENATVGKRAGQES